MFLIIYAWFSYIRPTMDVQNPHPNNEKTILLHYVHFNVISMLGCKLRLNQITASTRLERKIQDVNSSP